MAFAKKWNAVALRYFNPIGADESGLIGERPNGIPNNLLPYVLEVASGKRKAVSVYGNDYPTPDGTGVRDYIHVSDLADAHVAAFSYLCKKSADGIFSGSFGAFNVGTGKGTSVFEMVRMAEAAS
ncbi:MAG: UDP-glucose 4-epimerase [Patescibacteria group bacterium]|nr:UDP-glucose 4-epimerase [Patescibacteria group bacterium]